MAKKSIDYEDFVDKFKPKKTTDDCYTPPRIYDAVLDWARHHLDIAGRPVVRPFYPGGDYRHFNYPADCIVIDNPPFSIFAKIVDFYNKHCINYFLFAPGLTSMRADCTLVACGSSVTYENGARVNTSFVTNMLGDCLCCSAPELYRALDTAEKQMRPLKKLRKLSFPCNVLRTFSLLAMSKAGVDFRIGKDEGCVVTKACQFKEFGNSTLLSDKATERKLAAEKLAAEKLAAEKLAAEKLELNARSLELIAKLNKK